jgi:hypothetical protein
MKRHQLILSLVFAITSGIVVQTESQAQDGPFQRLVPRGRLLQKLRDDLNNGKPFISDPFANKPAATAPANNRAPANARPKAAPNKLPTPAAKQPVGRSPNVAGGKAKSPITNAGNQLRPNNGVVGNGRNGLSRPPQTLEGKFTASAPANQPRTSGSKPRLNSSPNSMASNQGQIVGDVDPLKIKATKGFGMVLKPVTENSFVIARINPNGNAANAGIKLGDKVESVGGVGIDSLVLYDEITKEMRGGDQLEFVVVRKGKQEKILVQFGELPKVDDQQIGTKAPAAPAFSPTSSEAMFDQQNPNTNRGGHSPTFAPPTTSSGMQSVLESGAAGNNQIDFPSLNGPSFNGPKR